jgi:glycerol-3-phosphate acyltransferase PlsY
MTDGAVAFGAAVSAAYLLGSVPTAYLLVRSIRGVDIRTLGSGNVGATNAGRALGRWGFVSTLLGDIAKGAVAILLAQRIAPDGAAVWAAVPSVIVGHVWPITLRFRGGKGVGPGIGALLVADPVLLAIGVAVFVALFGTSRRYQLSGLSSIVVLPFVAMALRSSRVELLGVALTVGLVLVAHQDDLREGFAARTRR